MAPSYGNRILEAKAEQCRRSFSAFVKAAWNHLPKLNGKECEWNWHHDALCLHLQTMAEEWAKAQKDPSHADSIQRIRNLLINIAPGTTKTLITMVFFPAWMWTRWPSWSVRCVSSNANVASDSSDETRKIASSAWYRLSFVPQTGEEWWAKFYDLKPWEVRDDKNAKSDWGNSAGGAMRATGMTGTVTGEHTDFLLCVAKGTKVSTEVGDVKIEDLEFMSPRPRVWSMNTETGKTELKAITAWAYNGKKKTVIVRTFSGDMLQCTDDHPVWTEKGYTEAACLVGGGVPKMLGSDRALERPSAVLQQMFNTDSDVYSVPNSVSNEECELQQEVQNFTDSVFSEMLSREPVAARDGDWELQLQRQSQELQLGSLGEYGATDTRTGRSSLHSMQRAEQQEQRNPRASYRRQSKEQCAGEPDYLVRIVPHDSSQVERTAVLSVDREVEGGCSEEVDVYDISVEGNHNFFANGILVHNCDDPHDAAQVNSPVMRQAAITKWDDALYNRVNDGRVACRVIVMQRLHIEDLAGHILDKDSKDIAKQNWCRIVIASEFEPGFTFASPIGWQDPRKEPGELLWPGRFPRKKLDEELARLMPRGYAAQHQQRPDSDATVGFLLEWWSWYTRKDHIVPLHWQRPDGAKQDVAFDLPLNRDESLDVDWVCVSVDPSGGSLEEGASSVGITIIAGKKEKRFIIDDCTPGPRKFLDQVEDVKKAVATAVRKTGKRSIRVLVELKAYGGAALEVMERAVKTGEYGLVDGKTVMITFEPYEVKASDGSKEQRGMALEPDLFSGAIHLPEGAPWLTAFLAEFRRFPAEPNDRVDSVAQCIERFRKRIGWAETFKKVGK